MLKNILYIACFYCSAMMYAHEIKGTVKDSKTGLPVENVEVYNQTSGASATTDLAGAYKLNNISEGDVIYFYALGYKTQSVTIKKSQLDGKLDISIVSAPYSLDQIVLVSKVNSLSTIVKADVKNNPVKSSQEILQRVPGLIIGQHAGGGKAEQIFLRGFDIDHGTDIALEVDGLPINMVSHAHGQGYADMHFIIPETIENIDFGKGPYYADKGNFNTAGYVNLQTKRSIDKNLFSLETGQFNTVRALGMFNILGDSNSKSSAYVGTELLMTDGVFESPQDFNRLNVMARYNYNNFTDEEFTVTFSHFQSKWNASGQIPVRAVEQGLISRFGAIDDTEGGSTSRTNFLVNHQKKLSDDQQIVSKAYISKYNFELFSNFTFFLESGNGDRPLGNNDQIAQREGRTIIGAESVYSHNFHSEDKDYHLTFRAGGGFRYDDVNDVELSQTQNRRYRIPSFTNEGILNLGDVDEANIYGFTDIKFRKNKWTLNPAVRIDYFNFGYIDKTSTLFDSRTQEKLIISPKFNVIYSPSNQLQLFAKTGFGFHSNDSRVVVATQQEIQADNPGAIVTDVEILPTAFGVDLGTIWKPNNNLVLNTTLWALNLEQEFVYVGDGAVVEPSGRSRRYGVEFGARYQINEWLYANADINYTIARSIDEPNGEDFIPLAPDFTSVGGLSVQNLGKFSGRLNYRYIDDRPANEDNSIVAEGYFVTDFFANYEFAKNWNIGIIVENIFDVEWNETQFATETRLQNEANSIEEITFTPGTPFNARLKLSVSF